VDAYRFVRLSRSPLIFAVVGPLLVAGMRVSVATKAGKVREVVIAEAARLPEGGYVGTIAHTAECRALALGIE
jgi:hypothetical protein